MIDKNPFKINFLFNEIACYYDKMNALMSLGMHYRIKKQSINLLINSAIKFGLFFSPPTLPCFALVSKKKINLENVMLNLFQHLTGCKYQMEQKAKKIPKQVRDDMNLNNCNEIFLDSNACLGGGQTLTKILDLCTGTGDIVQIISKQYKDIDIIGVDNSENMLKIAKSKNKKNNFVCADITDLPFKNNEFDYITISFGLRNIENRKKALDEIKRVLKPNGLFLHLDFGNHNLLSKVFDNFVLTIVKMLKINIKNYEYLIKSKNDYPEPKELIKEIESNGFRLTERKDFLFGSISAQVFSR